MQKEEILAQRDAMQSQKEFFEKQNRDIIGSIRYAERIQSAMLPTKSYIEKMLPKLLSYSSLEILYQGIFIGQQREMERK